MTKPADKAAFVRRLKEATFLFLRLPKRSMNRISGLRKSRLCLSNSNRHGLMRFTLVTLGRLIRLPSQDGCRQPICLCLPHLKRLPVNKTS